MSVETNSILIREEDRAVLVGGVTIAVFGVLLVLFHRELGIGMNLRVPGGAGMYRTLAGSAIRQRLRAESVSEEMRILYVALTRAKDGLILMVPMKRRSKRDLQK